MILRLYRVAWEILLPALRLLARWDAFARRQGFSPLPASWDLPQRLDPGCIPDGEGTLWIHGASLGEARAIWALAQNLDWTGPVLLTTMTVTGRDWLEGMRRQARGTSGAKEFRIRLFPADHPRVLTPFLDRNRIRAALFYEMELWPHALACLRRAEIPALWVSARLTPRAARLFAKASSDFREVLDSLAHIQARCGEDAGRIREFTRRSVEDGCDFKAAYYLAASNSGNEVEEPLPGGKERKGFALLSLHAGELKRLLPFLPALMARHPLVVFPRRPREFGAFREVLAPLGFSVFSQGGIGAHLLVDVLGQTHRFLPACHSAYVGGTLIPLGGHNLWEPLGIGLKIYLGPYHSLQEPLASQLLREGLAESASSFAGMAGWQRPGPDFPGRCGRFLERERGRLRLALGNLNAILKNQPVSHRPRNPVSDLLLRP